MTTEKITSKKEYDTTMSLLLELMNKGEANLNKKESETVRRLALAAQEYEKKVYTIPMPTTLTGMVEMKMYEKKLKQKELAKRMKLSQTKLSLILSGKQKPDVSFLKSAHKELGIDANFLLEHA